MVVLFLHLEVLVVKHVKQVLIVTCLVLHVHLVQVENIVRTNLLLVPIVLLDSIMEQQVMANVQLVLRVNTLRLLVLLLVLLVLQVQNSHFKLRLVVSNVLLVNIVIVVAVVV